MNKTGLVLILGGGENASAIALYLRQSNIKTAMVVTDSEAYLRRSICFNEAAYTGKKVVENTVAILVSPEKITEQKGTNFREKWQKAVFYHIQNREIPVFLKQDLPDFMEVLQPDIVVNTLSTSQIEVLPESVNLLIGMLPLHQPGQKCHVAIETRKNYQLGKQFIKETKLGQEFNYHLFKNPFSQIFSPLEGVFVGDKNIGERIKQNESIGRINDIEIRSPYHGQIWGLYYSGKMVKLKQPLALIYDGPAGEQYSEFDFAHRAVAGAVLKEVVRQFQS